VTNYLETAKELFGRVTIPEDDEDSALLGAMIAAVIAQAEEIGLARESVYDAATRQVWWQYASGVFDEDVLERKLSTIENHLGPGKDSEDQFNFMTARPKIDLKPVPTCGVSTPNGPCVLAKDHPEGIGFPGQNGHLSETMLEVVRSDGGGVHKSVSVGED
jgi:hypothetical protein